MVERTSKYEFVRVVAMFFVIGVHVVGNLPTDTELRTFFYYVLTLIFYTCNGLFYFLSGKFALEQSCDTLKDYLKYYKKKVRNLIIPMLFYMCLRSAYEARGLETGQFWKSCVINILSGYSGTEYWYLYGLIGNVLCAPFLSKAFKKANKAGIWIFVILGIGYNALATYLPLAGLLIAWSYPFGGWTLYFYLGYCIEKIIDTKTKERCAIWLGIVCFVSSIVQKYNGVTLHIHDWAPTYIIITCAVFILLKNAKIEEMGKNIIKVNSFVGKHSFAVYMVHITIMGWVMRWRPFENYYLGYLILITVVVAIISLLIGTAIDNSIVYLIKQAFDKTCLCLKRGIERKKNDTIA